MYDLAEYINSGRSALVGKFSLAGVGDFACRSLVKSTYLYLGADLGTYRRN